LTAGDAARWVDTLTALIADAPESLRELASDELHIGGFTNVQLAHPLLDLRGVGEAVERERALAFFLGAALLRGATVARVHAASGAEAARLARIARRRLAPALARVDDESTALLRYFDAYLVPAETIEAAAGKRLAGAVKTLLSRP
jgi:hypothetical protein